MNRKLAKKEIYETYTDGTHRFYTIDNISYDKSKRKEAKRWEFKSLLEEEDLKNFIHVLHNSLELSDRDIARAVYLSSFLDSSGKLVHDNNRPISKKDLEKILSISASEKRKLFNRLREADILYEYNECLYINPGYFCKGKARAKEYSRMFKNTIRGLYEQMDINSLALVYKILPYVSFWHNVLCFNPSGGIAEEIQPMTWEQFANIAGWKNGYDFKKKVTKYKLANKENIFKAGAIGNTKMIYINPRVVFRNSDKEIFKTLMAIFKIGK